ncbi:MAG: tetratricopeptide repeat protein [Gaiellales bacterium]
MTEFEGGSEYSNESLRKLGARIRHYRRKRAMTQRDLSFDGCSYSYLARIEAGDRRPSPRVLYEIARRLEVSPEELTGETSTEQRSRSLEALESAMLIREGRFDDAEDLLRGVLREAQVSADAERVSEAYEGLGLVALRRDQVDEASTLLHEALESTHDADPGERIDLYAGLVETYRRTGDASRAMALTESCLTRLRRQATPDPAKAVRYSLWLSSAYAEAGDHARAAAVLADALRDGAGHVDLASRASAAFALARHHAAEGRIEQAIRHTDRALAMYDLEDDNRALRDAHLSYAQSLLDTNDADQAAPHLDAARSLTGPDPNSDEAGVLAVEEARLALLEGDDQRAAAHAQRAVDILARASNPARVGDAHLVLARVQDSLGEIERSERSYGEAIAAFTEGGDRRALGRAYRFYGKFLKRLGRAEAALEAFELAADMAPVSLGPMAPLADRHVVAE